MKIIAFRSLHLPFFLLRVRRMQFCFLFFFFFYGQCNMVGDSGSRGQGGYLIANDLIYEMD